MTHCPSCSSTDVVGFTLAPKGESLQFTHCRSCENRWWQEIDRSEAVPLTAVLGHIAA
jgi:formate dehydrogenase maturation protein FdhE